MVQISEKIFIETDNSFEDFMGNCCKQWENAADQFNPIARVIKFRLGLF